MDEDDFYEERLDNIFGKGTMWKHRTFRTILDPYSTEWNQTDYAKKIEILETLTAAGEDLEILIRDYKERYNKQNRKDISSSVEHALILLFQYKLSQ
ncbi:MAG: hypothetical protein RLZZ46_1700 [Bacteroidota bacterium]|jgi:hypothetical protein